MRRAVIDLDVVTVALWDKGKSGDISRRFISRVEKGEFYVITPSLLLDLVNKWKHKNLRKKIEEFYFVNTDEFVERVQIIQEIISKNIDFEILFNELVKKSIKEEDITLILVSSLKNTELITFNKIHLRNKEVEIKRSYLNMLLGRLELLLQQRFKGLFKFFVVIQNSFTHAFLNLICKTNKFFSFHIFDIFHIYFNILILFKTFVEGGKK